MEDMAYITFDKLEQLKGIENYRMWRRQVTIVLQCKDFEEVLEDVTADRAQEADFKRMHKMARGLILLTVSPELWDDFEENDSLKEILAKFEKLYADKSEIVQSQLFTEISSLRLEDCASVSNYISKMTSLFSRMCTAGQKIEESMKTSMLINGLPKEYDALIIELRRSAAGKPIGFDTLKTALLTCRTTEPNTTQDTGAFSARGRGGEFRQGGRGGHERKATNNFNNQRGGGRGRGRPTQSDTNRRLCYNCHSPDHFVKYCPYKHGFSLQKKHDTDSEECHTAFTVEKNLTVYLDCVNVTRYIIAPQYCRFYPKLTIKLLTLKALNSTCFDPDCRFKGLNNIYRFFDMKKKNYDESRLARPFFDHFSRYPNDSVANWRQVIDKSAKKCVKEIASKYYGTYGLANAIHSSLSCVYQNLYLSQNVTKDIYNCERIDKFIKEKNNCKSTENPYPPIDFWYTMSFDEEQEIAKREKDDCMQIFRLFPKPQGCCFGYPENVFSSHSNECDFKCPKDANFTFCYFACINQKFRLASNLSFDKAAFRDYFLTDFKGDEVWHKIVSNSVDRCNEHFYYHMIRGREEEQPQLVSNMISCIFKFNFLNCPTVFNKDCKYLEKFIAKPIYCGETDLDLLPAALYYQGDKEDEY